MYIYYHYHRLNWSKITKVNNVAIYEVAEVYHYSFSKLFGKSWKSESIKISLCQPKKHSPTSFQKRLLHADFNVKNSDEESEEFRYLLSVSREPQVCHATTAQKG